MQIWNRELEFGGARSRRDAVEDMLKDIKTNQFINFTIPEYEVYPCQKILMPEKNPSNNNVNINIEIPIISGCFLIIMAMLWLIMKKINSLSHTTKRSCLGCDKSAEEKC